MPIILGSPKKGRKTQFSRKRPPIQIYPRLLETKYAKLVKDILSQLKALLDADLVPELRNLSQEFSRDFGARRNDDFIGTLQRIIRGIMVKFAGIVKSREIEITRVATEVDLWSKKQHRNTISHILGVNILENDRSLSAAIDMWVKQNVDLIVNISLQEKIIIEQLVSDAFKNGRSHQELQDALEDHWKDRDKRKTNWVPGFSVPYRAELVARDQIGKLNGQISNLRQEAVGVERYIWRTALDERVRDSHKVLEGKIFYWNSKDGPQPPPQIGHPGNDYRCRCYAEPILEDILGFDPNE